MTTIDFGLRDCSEYDDKERKLWWESMRTWFADKGYNLYQTVYYGTEHEFIREEPSSVFSGEVQFPYAHFGGCSEEHCTLYCRMHPRIVYAQDSLLRHVAIKVIVTDSDEYRILCLLHEQQPSKFDIHGFPCVMPILDMLPFGNHHFAIMPRWGTFEQNPWFSTVEEMLDCIHCSLTGLTFLHKHRIFHRDIIGPNILVNHFSCDEGVQNDMRHELRSQKQLVSALNDFDWAILLPPDTNIKECRLPLIDARPGIDDKPLEVLHGEVDFNPFAYDVASLGIEFCFRYQHLCSVVPLLAPLLSGMVTHDVAQRFTAEEALAFFDEHRANLSEEVLKQMPEPVPCYARWTEPVWWDDIPAQLARSWDRYRSKPEHFLVTSVLRPLCRRRWGVHLVHYLRLFLSPWSLWRYGWKAFLC